MTEQDDFFNLSDFKHRDLWQKGDQVWDALKRLHTYLEELISIAAQNNFDIGETNKYLTSDDDQESLLNEEIQAKKIGIRGVPCFIVNKEYVLFGVQNKEKFIELFTNLIKK